MPEISKDEAFSIAHRMSAVDAIRHRAKQLRQKAARWESLANSLEEIERYAHSQSKDGNESGPHIGAGSAAEELLWELATKPIES